MMAKSKKGQVPDFANAPSLTKETFEKELQQLAAKAKEETTSKYLLEQLTVILRSLSFLVLAALSSNASQLVLSPVYGAIPASIWHGRLVMVACFLGWSFNLWLSRNLPHKIHFYLPLLAAWAPVNQFFLLKLSASFGSFLGPLLTEALTFAPVLILSASCTAMTIEDLDLSRLPAGVAEATPGIMSYVTFLICESKLLGHLLKVFGSSILLTRVGLQIVLTISYAAMAPSKLLIYAIPALLHTVAFNTHLQAPWTTHSLNSSLAASGWSLLARRDSLTGYISVMESPKLGYRVLRCDHSLLGGEWIKSPELPDGLETLVKEPIYAVFTMLEAVRLVEVPNTIPDKEASALVIGMGIGTTPAALITHGIDTTIVEIDPVVYKYAIDYFGLPARHTAVIADAVEYASQIANSSKYDYIVHDVFTGGAEPPSLFTLEFMQDLSSALKPDGVIAINYAGDLLLPSGRLVIRTIQEVFPSCVIYRELPPLTEEELEETNRDFTNMVIFCTKQKEPVKFRRPTEEDFLRSPSRRRFLLPEHRIDADVSAKYDEPLVLRKNDTSSLIKAQEKSAVGHWEVMRTVLPAKIWESW